MTKVVNITQTEQVDAWITETVRWGGKRFVDGAVNVAGGGGAAFHSMSSSPMSGWPVACTRDSPEHYAWKAPQL